MQTETNQDTTAFNIHYENKVTLRFYRLAKLEYSKIRIAKSFEK